MVYITNNSLKSPNETAKNAKKTPFREGDKVSNSDEFLLLLTIARVQTSPLPQKKIGRRDNVSSPDFFLREGGRLYKG